MAATGQDLTPGYQAPPPGHDWEVRAYAGSDPLTGKDRYASRTIRGGRRDAEKLLSHLVAKLDPEGPTAWHTQRGAGRPHRPP